jgi:hypothetical protein
MSLSARRGNELYSCSQVVAVKRQYPLVLRFTLASFLVISVSSFSIFSDTSTDQQTTKSRVDAPMAISVAFYDEWEPGLQREIRQISIDGIGHGQVSTRSDDLVTHVDTFDYLPGDFDTWSAQTVAGLSDAYLSTELEDQGLIVEGNAPSFKFYFAWSGQIKIVDAEPGYSNTPAVLVSLAQQLRTYAKSAHAQPLQAYYLSAIPLGPQQSAEIMHLFGTLPEADSVRQLLHESERVVLDVPAWMVVLHDNTRQKIMDAFGMDAGSDFQYMKSRTEGVIKMEFVAARPAGW